MLLVYNTRPILMKFGTQYPEQICHNTLYTCFTSPVYYLVKCYVKVGLNTVSEFLFFYYVWRFIQDMTNKIFCLLFSRTRRRGRILDLDLSRKGTGRNRGSGDGSVPVGYEGESSIGSLHQGRSLFNRWSISFEYNHILDISGSLLYKIKDCIERKR